MEQAMTKEHDCIPDYEQTIAHIEKYGLTVIAVTELGRYKKYHEHWS
jgi:hypothetical protein